MRLLAAVLKEDRVRDGRMHRVAEHGSGVDLLGVSSGDAAALGMGQGDYFP